MKKTLVALAAVSAVSAFAQVSLTGVVDVGYYTAKNDQNSQVNWAGLAQNGMSTTAFFFKGAEDLGGGTKAIFTAELDWSPVISNSANQNSTTAPFAGTVYSGTPFNGEQFVGLEGNFGSIKLGTPNSPMLDVATAYAQPFGTALGGGFSSSFGRFGTGTASGYNQYVGGDGGTGRIIRHEKTAVYTTPEFAPGLKAQIEYSAQNANGGWTANDNGLFGATLRYNQGPLAVAASSTKASAGGTAAAGSDSLIKLGAGNGGSVAIFTANVLPANASTTWNMLAGNYTMGATTVFAGFSTTKTDGITTQKVLEDSKSYNVAVKYVMGNVDLLANYLTRKSGLLYNEAFDSAISSTYTPTAKLLGLGANYNLSKNTMIYGRYESIRGLNANATTSTTTAINGVVGIGSYGNATQTKTQVGIRMAF